MNKIDFIDYLKEKERLAINNGGSYWKYTYNDNWKYHNPSVDIYENKMIIYHTTIKIFNGYDDSVIIECDFNYFVETDGKY